MISVVGIVPIPTTQSIEKEEIHMRTKTPLPRRLLALLTILCLLTSATACATTGNPPEETSPHQNVSPGETEASYNLDELPADLDYNGDEVVVLTSAGEINVDKVTGNILNDILFERNQAVERRLNISFSFIQDASAIDKLGMAINAGDDEYDILIEAAWRAIIKSTENYFLNLRQTEHLDFDKIWWSQGFNEAFAYNDAQYAVTGDMLLSPYRRTYATVFNKDLFTKANQTFLYEYVDDHTWTLDKQTALIPLFHQDNGNHVQDMDDDIYGFVSTTHIYVDCYWAACEVDIIRKNMDGEYEWVFSPEKIYDVTEKLLALYYQDGSYIEQDNAVSEATPRSIFSGGKSAMATLCMDILETPEMRLMTQEYGVVPMPKYSEEQTSYHSQMHDGFHIISIPSTTSEERSDMLSSVLEAMGSTSYQNVRPIYYETVLRTQIASDPQSAAMMDTIINNIYIDIEFAYTHQLGTFHHKLQEVMKSGRIDNITSTFKQASKASQKALAQLVQKLNQLSN